MYDNEIKTTEGNLGHLTNLVKLDLSFNKFRAVGSDIALLVNLREIYFVQNKISTIAGLETLTNLRTLELGANRIRTIQGLVRIFKFSFLEP